MINLPFHNLRGTDGFILFGRLEIFQGWAFSWTFNKAGAICDRTTPPPQHVTAPSSPSSGWKTAVMSELFHGFAHKEPTVSVRAS